jgi:ATP-dependent Clp protease ATP-binding subunit ClpA
MLQILDDGRITDAQGRMVNFENTIIIMTSNAGSDRGENLMGFGKSTLSATNEKAIKALEEFLRPEFISRVDEIIVFNELNDTALTEIAELNLKELGETLKEKMIEFKFTEEVANHFAKECSGSKRGARDLRNMIRKNIEDVIVNAMIENSERFLTEVSVSVKKNEIKIEYKF